MDEAIAPTSIHRFIFNKEIYARYVRIVPLDYTDACLKMEIIGCLKRGKNTTKTINFLIILYIS